VGPQEGEVQFAQTRCFLRGSVNSIDDVLASYYQDPDHSADEKRLLTIGTSARGRLLYVAFADRKQRIRIISARVPTKQEKKLYEKENR